MGALTSLLVCCVGFTLLLFDMPSVIFQSVVFTFLPNPVLHTGLHLDRFFLRKTYEQYTNRETTHSASPAGRKMHPNSRRRAKSASPARTAHAPAPTVQGHQAATLGNIPLAALPPLSRRSVAIPEVSCVLRCAAEITMGMRICGLRHFVLGCVKGANVYPHVGTIQGPSQVHRFDC